MTLNRKNNVRIGILVVVLVENMYLYLSEGAMVQQLPFQDVDGGHLVVDIIKLQWYIQEDSKERAHSNILFAICRTRSLNRYC